MTVNQVRWNGKTWLLVGDLADGGAIAHGAAMMVLKSLGAKYPQSA